MSKGGDRPGGSLQAGSTISRYRVISPLGAGGMGEVYMARDESLERTVALKVLPADLVRNEERVRRFVTEAKSASSLSHPHIVTIHEIGHAEVRTESSPAGGAETSAPIHYIAMELVTGDTLRQLIHEKATDLRTLLRWLAQAADGIAKAHAAGIVHRDLKPDNIMVTKDGYAKVLDFGLAKLTERQEAGPDLTSAPTVGGQATREGTIIGTAGYMSPEQVQGKAVDHRSDIFSFGCILYEAATRRRAFAADSDVETMHKILKDKPVPIEELNPEAPSELRRLIRRCLAKSPEQRLQSMKDVAIELNEIAEEYDELSVPSGSRLSATRGSGASGSDGFVPGGAPSSAGNAGSVGQGWPASGASRENESLSGRAPRDAAAGGGSRPGSSGAGAAYPSSPSVGPAAGELAGGGLGIRAGGSQGAGRRVIAGVAAIALVAVVAAGAWKLLHRGGSKDAAPTGSFQAMKMTHLASVPDLRSAALSPDGKYLAYTVERDGKFSLWVRQVVTGSDIQVLPPKDEETSRVTFSPDGNYLYYLAVDEGNSSYRALYQVPTLGGTPRKLVFDVDSPVTFSPDGRQVAFVRGAPQVNESHLIVAKTDGSGETKLAARKIPKGFLTEAPSWSPDGARIAAIGQEFGSGLRLGIIEVDAATGKETELGSQAWQSIDGLAWLPDGSGLAVTATDVGSSSGQVWFLSSPGGEARKITNDLNDYSGINVSADSRTIATTQRRRTSNLWVAPLGKGAVEKQISSGSGTENAINQLQVAPSGAIVYAAVQDGLSQLWSMEPDGSGRRRLSPEGAECANPQVASRAGTILFTCLSAGRVPHIWKTNADGGSPGQLTSGKGEFIVAVSPDARSMIFGRAEDPGFWQGPLDGASPVRFSETAQNEAAWSPDGKFILRSASRRDAKGLYVFGTEVVPSGGGAPVKWIERKRDFGFHWSPSGDGLAFIRPLQGVDNVWFVPLAGGDPKPLTDYKSGRIFDLAWAPDGKGLVLARGEVNTDIVLISNFK